MSDQVLDDMAGTREHRPLVELLLLAAPTVAQMASYTLMQFADRYMLAIVGDVEAGAAGGAGMVFFSVLGFGFGIMMVVNTLVSQAFGREDLPSTGRYLWQGIWVGVAYGLVTLSLYFVADRLFLWMGHEPRVAVLEAAYLKVVALGGWLKLASTAGAQFLLGLHRPGVVLVAAVAGVFGNLLFNWLLIYGNWGFPRLGIAGAAWGTNAAVLLECLVMLAYVARPAVRTTFYALDWRPRWKLMRTLLRVGLPAGFQFICDITAWTVFMVVIVASFGTPAYLANSYAFSYMHVCFMPAVGVGAAVTALVGRYIGAGKPHLAERRAHLGFAVCAVYMMAAGAMLALFRQPLIAIFTQDPETQRIGEMLMFFVALYQIFDAMFLVYVSALRGAGDTMVPAAVQAVLVWTIVVGGGTVVALWFPQAGVAGLWVLAMAFGAILGFYLLLRFRKGAWKEIRLHHEDTPAFEPAVA